MVVVFDPEVIATDLGKMLRYLGERAGNASQLRKYQEAREIILSINLPQPCCFGIFVLSQPTAISLSRSPIVLQQDP